MKLDDIVYKDLDETGLYFKFENEYLVFCVDPDEGNWDLVTNEIELYLVYIPNCIYSKYFDEMLKTV